MKFKLRKLLLCLALVQFMSAQAYDKIGLRFNRTGTDVASVTATAVDQNGATIEGAQISITSNKAFKATSNDITSGILCFDANANTSPDITFTINITGLKESVTFSEVGVDIHALNGSSRYQQNNDNAVRQWNVALKNGENNFGSLDNIDIAANVGSAGSVHKYWSLAGSEVSASGSLSLTFSITKGTTNNGCFLGISDITIGGNERIESGNPEGPVPAIVGGEGKYYHIVWHDNTNSYLTETRSSVLQVEGKSNVAMQYWQFIPTGKDNCYYIKNAVSGQYIEECKTSNNNSYNISAQSEPVEYYASQESARNNAFRLTSTNCSNYSNTAASPVGLNKNGANSYIITWTAGTGNTGSYWYVNETPFDYDAEAAEQLRNHTAFAKQSQIYFMPCGNFSATYAARTLTLGGEGAVKTLEYPCNTWSGSSKKTGSANTSSWWTMYTTDKGQVARGKQIVVDVTLAAKPATGYLAQVCFDWDHDGIFEDVQTIEEPKSSKLQFSTVVPAEAKMGESRMRFRLTDNGLDNPDEDVTAGQILDCAIITVDWDGQLDVARDLKISANDDKRGSVVAAEADATHMTVSATPFGNATFLCWTEGNKVVSTNADYTFEFSRPMSLTAVFSANTDVSTSVAQCLGKGTDTIFAAPRYYDLGGRCVTNPEKGITYIRKHSAKQGKIIIY